MTRSVLVLGGRGMLGSAVRWYFAKAGWNVRAPNRAHFDILATDTSDLDLGGIDAVVNAAGLTNRWLDKLGKSEFLLANAVFPRRLADHCDRTSVPLIHISTDCVFDGKTAPHTEDDRATAFDLYGHSKRLGEAANAMVIRTSIIGPEAKNFYSLLCWFLRSKHVTGYANHLWNGVVTTELARCLELIFSKDLHRPGLFHVFGEDVSKLELLHKIQSAYGVKIEIASGHAVEPKDMRLATRHPRFLSDLGVRPLDVQLKLAASLSDDTGCWFEDARS